MSNYPLDLEIFDIVAMAADYGTVLEMSAVDHRFRLRYNRDKYLKNTPEYPNLLRKRRHRDSRKMLEVKSRRSARGVVRTICSPNCLNGRSGNMYRWIIKDTFAYTMLKEAGCTFTRYVDMTVSLETTADESCDLRWNALRWNDRSHTCIGGGGVVGHHKLPCIYSKGSVYSKPIGYEELPLRVPLESLDELNILYQGYERSDPSASAKVVRSGFNKLLVIIPVTVTLLGPIDEAKEKAISELESSISSARVSSRIARLSDITT